MAKERRLGKGLDALLNKDRKASGSAVTDIDPDQIVPSPTQPRLDIEPEAMEALIESISRNGILQPIVVRKAGKKYELVAGERRWRAAQHLGLTAIPAVVRDVPDDQMLELALVENIQRSDLNPIEKAKAFSQLIREYNLTQAQAADRVGMDRSSVANFIRLLDLPSGIQSLVSRETLTMGHARALLGCRSQRQQKEIAERIQKDDLSVRAVEALVSASPTKKQKVATKDKSPDVSEVETKISDRLGLKTTLKPKTDHSGQVVVRYKTLEDLDVLLEALGLK